MSGDRDDGQKRRRAAQRRRARSGEDQGRARPEGDHPNDGNGDDYEVGFGKPPRSTRFQKGRSGNPRGRPKKPKPKPKPIELADAPSDYFLEQEAYRLLKFRENGEEVELPASQAVVRSAIMSALKGNRLSQRYVIEHLEQKEAARQQLKIERYRRLEAAKRDGQQVLAACGRSGKPEPELLPHPDDVILDPNTLDARVIGPSSAAEARRCAHRIALRAHLLHRAAHADRYGATRSGSSIATGRSGWLLLAQVLNLGLPPRLQWTDQDMTSALMRYAALPKRDSARQIETEGERLAHEWQAMKSLPPELERQIKELIGQVMPAAMD
ncbi:DUF5681 domain-containing protein [Minwuia thermotolerans]|uniref:DUF5681 domain-containing protein n=1 Tax=Minwuia thermotolerans TaxID=2056226 RepID=A0A2M9FW04_9PROT|nr:DUF5681 domain-containing protein [Minwuia thermotolerans]PJK27655.1 hypothetical protein CVT23_21080 [Minwuia thermotolerans]